MPPKANAGLGASGFVVAAALDEKLNPPLVAEAGAGELALPNGLLAAAAALPKLKLGAAGELAAGVVVAPPPNEKVGGFAGCAIGEKAPFVGAPAPTPITVGGDCSIPSEAVFAGVVADLKLNPENGAALDCSVAGDLLASAGLLKANDTG